MTKPTKKKTKEKAEPTPAEMRVLIAKDVIAALKARRIIADRGTYCTIPFRAQERFFDKLSKLHQAGTTLPDKPIVLPKACQVCAIGAIFVAAVDRYDKLTVRHAYRSAGGGSMEMIDHLRPWFTESQLRNIESAFEGFASAFAERGENTRLRMFHDAASKTRNPDEIMRAIMKNIIKNKGEFIAPPLPEAMEAS